MKIMLGKGIFPWSRRVPSIAKIGKRCQFQISKKDLGSSQPCQLVSSIGRSEIISHWCTAVPLELHLDRPFLKLCLDVGKVIDWLCQRVDGCEKPVVKPASNRRSKKPRNQKQIMSTVEVGRAEGVKRRCHVIYEEASWSTRYVS